MTRILQDLDDLDRLVDGGAAKDEVRSQIRVIQTQVAMLQAEFATLAQEHQRLQLAQSLPPLQHVRGVYYMSGDPVPFCPRCYEIQQKRIHLFGPIELMNSSVERWDCHACNKYYAANPEENFTPGQIRP